MDYNRRELYVKLAEYFGAFSYVRILCIYFYGLKCILYADFILFSLHSFKNERRLLISSVCL